MPRTAIVAVIFALLLAPPVFNRAFAMEHLLAREELGLWLLSASLMLVAAYGRWGGRRAQPVWGVVACILALTSVELAARLMVKVFFPSQQLTLSRWGNMSYEDLLAYRGHPFLQFTGTPSVALIGNQALGNLTPFNNFGFLGRDFSYEKPAGVIRIAALGGSTTADGYPQRLEDLLNARAAGTPQRFEVLNFGVGYWTSAHSLVNFVLNVVDFQPDYVIIHENWNDGSVRGAGASFRHDYSHALKAFEPPRMLDRYPLRFSVIYRAVRFRFGPPDWAFLDYATHRPYPRQQADATDDLQPFRRNITTIIDLALLRHAKVVLTTMPRTTDATMPLFSGSTHVDEANDALRQLAAPYGDRILFVDLDQLMTGKRNEIFLDLCHMKPEGIQAKAEHIAQRILQDWQADTPRRTDPTAHVGD
jgi:hypothetical protein